MDCTEAIIFGSGDTRRPVTARYLSSLRLCIGTATQPLRRRWHVIHKRSKENCRATKLGNRLGRLVVDKNKIRGWCSCLDNILTDYSLCPQDFFTLTELLIQLLEDKSLTDAQIVRLLRRRAYMMHALPIIPEG